MTASDAHRAIEAVWRLESARIIAGLTRIVRDVGLAEELAQDALVAVLEQWPESGVPDNPGAWLMVTAKHRAIDRLRRNERLERKIEQLGHEAETRQETAVLSGVADSDNVIDDDGAQDDLLRLMFISCHPVLSTGARIALTLRLLGGLTTEEIARAFLVSEPTVAQRIVRAKRTLAAEHIPFGVPPQAGRVVHDAGRDVEPPALPPGVGLHPAIRELGQAKEFGKLVRAAAALQPARRPRHDLVSAGSEPTSCGEALGKLVQFADAQRVGPEEGGRAARMIG